MLAAQRGLDAIDRPPEGEFHERVMAASHAARAATAEWLPDPTDLVVFRIGDDRYAIDAAEVLEVVQLSRITALPGVPAFYRGLIIHRGVIFSLVDIRSLVDETDVEATSPEHAILILREERAIAIAADSAESFVRIATSEIAMTSDNEPGRSAAIRGVAPDGIVVLDVGALLADARLVIDDRSSRG